MPIDASIYKPVDISAAFGQGLNLANMANQMRIAGQEQARKENLRQAYKQGVVQQPDGSYKVDENLTLSALAKTDPETFIQQKQLFAKQKNEELTNTLKAENAKLELTGKILSSGRGSQANYDAAKKKLEAIGLSTDHLPKVWDETTDKTIANHLRNLLSYKDQQELKMKELGLDVNAAKAHAIKEYDKAGNFIGYKPDPNYVDPYKSLDAEVKRVQLGLNKRKLDLQESDINKKYEQQQKELDFKISKMEQEAKLKRLKEAKEKEEKRKKYNVPGLNFSGDVELSNTDITKVRKTVAQAGPIVKSLEDAKRMIESSSRLQWLDPDWQILFKQKLRDAQIGEKGEAFYQLGVLNGKDLEILQDVVSNPLSFKGLYSGPEGMTKAYQEAINLVKFKTESFLTAFGYEVKPDTFNFSTSVRASKFLNKQDTGKKRKVLKTNQIKWKK